MKELTLSDFHINKKEKRNAYYKVLDFIDSDLCYDGVVAVLYGLRATGKKNVMHQLIADNSDRFSFAFLEATNEDTMDDVYSFLDEAFHNKIHCVFIDEITNIPNFIDDSALLADIYAKEGIRIVLSGTDSLNFIFAENSQLYGRTENISTTYIPFWEHMRVLGTNDINDYICYGGLTKNGSEKEDHTVYDYRSACEYLDEAVVGNIYRSLQCYSKYFNYNALFKLTPTEMNIAIRKLVEKYSGVLNTTLVNEALKKIVLSFSTGGQNFKELGGTEIFRSLRMNKPDIAKDFATAINTDTRIVHKFAIRNTTEPDNDQCRHLLNEKFKEIIDYKYGKREEVSVLYNGKPFRTPSGVMYLNISDFVKEVTHCKNIKVAMQKEAIF